MVNEETLVQKKRDVIFLNGLTWYFIAVWGSVATFNGQCRCYGPYNERTTLEIKNQKSIRKYRTSCRCAQIKLVICRLFNYR